MCRRDALRLKEPREAAANCPNEGEGRSAVAHFKTRATACAGTWGFKKAQLCRWRASIQFLVTGVRKASEAEAGDEANRTVTSTRGSRAPCLGICIVKISSSCLRADKKMDTILLQFRGKC